MATAIVWPLMAQSTRRGRSLCQVSVARGATVIAVHIVQDAPHHPRATTTSRDLAEALQKLVLDLS